MTDHEHYEYKQEIWRIWAYLRQLGGMPIAAAGSVTTTPYTSVVVCNSAAPLTVSLHTATGSWQKIVVKNVGAGAVTVDGYLAQTIDGAASFVLGMWDSITIVDYGVGTWAII